MFGWLLGLIPVCDGNHLFGSGDGCACSEICAACVVCMLGGALMHAGFYRVSGFYLGFV